MQVTPFGFYLETEKIGDIDCSTKLSKLDLLLGFYLSNQDDFQKFGKCYNEQSNYKLKTLFRGQDFRVSKEIKTFKFQKEEKLTENFIKSFDDALSYLKRKKGKFSRSEQHQLRTRIENYTNILARLVEALLYVEAKNISKAKKIIFSILSTDFFEHAFSSDLYFLNKKKQVQMTLAVLKHLKTKESLADLFDPLIFYLSYNSTGEFKDAIDQNVIVLSSSSEIKKKYESYRYGRRLPYVWGPYLFESRSRKEFQRFVQTSFSNEIDLKRSDLLFFRDAKSLDKKLKTTIVKKLSASEFSSSHYKDYIYFILLDNDSFYQLVDAHSKEKIGLITGEKRKLFMSYLSVPKLSGLGLLGLLEIGNIHLRYIEEDILSHE